MVVIIEGVGDRDCWDIVDSWLIEDIELIDVIVESNWWVWIELIFSNDGKDFDWLCGSGLCGWLEEEIEVLVGGRVFL